MYVPIVAARAATLDLAPALFETVASTQGQGERYLRNDLTARVDYARRIDPVPGTKSSQTNTESRQP